MKTSNSTIKRYTKTDNSDELSGLEFGKKITKIDDTQVLLCYQTQEGDYQPRSFEDAFFAANEQFIRENKDNFEYNALKPRKLQGLLRKDFDAYKIAECVNSKASLAIEILLNSDEKFGNWNIPAYINEGLAWLRK